MDAPFINQTEEKASELVAAYDPSDCVDDEDFQIQYDDAVMELTTFVQMNGNPRMAWEIVVNNSGWRNRDGIKWEIIENGTELLRAALPQCDCTFKVYKYGKRGLKIRNWHHDSPTGNEWYYITPVTIKYYDKNHVV